MTFALFFNTCNIVFLDQSNDFEWDYMQRPLQVVGKIKLSTLFQGNVLTNSNEFFTHLGKKKEIIKRERGNLG